MDTKAALVISGVIASGIFATVMLMQTREEPEKKEVERLAPLVEVLELTPTLVTFEIPSRGTVTPLIETQLSAEVSGQIVSVSDKFVAGGVFAAGETLARIDAVVYRAAVQRARALLEQRRIEFEGIEKLGAKGYRSETELAGAKAALETAKADLITAERNLDRTRIRAPFAGMVRARSVDIGQFVNVGTALGQVFGTDVAEVRLPLSEREQEFVRLPEASSLVDGASMEPVPVVLTGRYRGKPAEWAAKIVRTEGVVDSANRVTFAVARVNDPYALSDDAAGRAPLPMGTFTNAGISGISVGDVYKVPQQAVRGNDRLLMVDADSKLRVRTADIIRIDDDYAYVLAESVEENLLVLTALEAPLNGATVRTQFDLEAPEQAEDSEQLAVTEAE